MGGMNSAMYHTQVWMGVCAHRTCLMMEAVGRAPWALSTCACRMPFMFVDGVCGGNGCGVDIPWHTEVWVPEHPRLWVCRSFASTHVRSRLDVAVCGVGVMTWLLSCRPVAQCPSPASHSRKLAHGVRCSRLVGVSTSMRMSASYIACQSNSVCAMGIAYAAYSRPTDTSSWTMCGSSMQNRHHVCMSGRRTASPGIWGKREGILSGEGLGMQRACIQMDMGVCHPCVRMVAYNG